MIRSASRLGALLGIAMLLVMASTTAWAAPVSFGINDPSQVSGITLPGLGTAYQLILSIEDSANLFKDQPINTVITNGAIMSGGGDDVLVGKGPFSISNAGGGRMVVNATLMPVNGGFLSGPLLAQVTLNGVNFNNTSVALSSVPEPTTLLLLGPSLAGLAMLRRRWQKPMEA
jgi:hypothetical protein